MLCVQAGAIGGAHFQHLTADPKFSTPTARRDRHRAQTAELTEITQINPVKAQLEILDHIVGAVFDEDKGVTPALAAQRV